MNTDYTLSEENGARIAAANDETAPVQRLAVLPDGESRLFHRKGIHRNLATGEITRTCWLVAELNGVRVYIDGAEIIVTTQDINP